MAPDFKVFSPDLLSAMEQLEKRFEPLEGTQIIENGNSFTPPSKDSLKLPIKRSTRMENSKKGDGPLGNKE
ncbi:hypothetical protein QWY85_17335 [Neolewinella lacunae]|uniref:Uncharacterized protein n=1 Tax=Neolewinella lacunae TaxID=1517758 RepID=A0A923T9T4_9BACT|nr:hypothetical protein [Neolewinella lacunae]MBC6995874.1 hypothetical protein [Neolewinella lacunae]MDN3636433.1 hypothetical protein [Neolewinella lacunae]